jgi:DNA-binding response OmpR family regulator
MGQEACTDAKTDEKTIVVVEDDENIGPVLVEVLSQETPYKAIWVSDGLQALELIHSMKPNLFITDYWLPHMNGIELYDRLRTIKDYNTIPTIIISAYLPEKEIHERHLTALSKPFDLDELLEMVEKMIT